MTINAKVVLLVIGKQVLNILIVIQALFKRGASKSLI